MITKNQNFKFLISLAAMAGIILQSCPTGCEEKSAEGFGVGESFSLPDMQERVLPCSYLSAFTGGSDARTGDRRVTEPLSRASL